MRHALKVVHASGIGEWSSKQSAGVGVTASARITVSLVYTADEGELVDLTIGSEHVEFVEWYGGDVKPEHKTNRWHAQKLRPIEQLELTVERVEKETRQLIRVTTVSGSNTAVGAVAACRSR